MSRQRILFFSTIYPDAVATTRGTYNLALCRALAEQHDVRVISPRPFGEYWPQRIRGGYQPRIETDDAALPTRYPCYWYLPKVWQHHSAEWLWYSTAATFRQMFREFRPDAVLSYWAHPDGAVGLRAAQFVGARSAVIVGGSDVLLLPQIAARRPKVLQVLQDSDAVLTVSDGLRQTVLDLGGHPDRVHTFYQGVDDSFHPGDRATSRQRLGLPTDVPILVWVGRMVPVKGLEILVAACAALSKRGTEFLLCLVGDGPLRSDVQQQADRLGLSTNLHFAGGVPPEQIAEYYRAANVTVMSSWSEGLPNVLRESLACGTPFVSTDVGSVREIAHDSYSRLVPAGDSQALVMAIETVLSDHFAEAARQHPIQTWQQSAAMVTRRLFPS